MFDALLYPELFPTLTAPSNTFALTQAGLQEIGATLTLAFSAAFNRGSIDPAYGTDGFRSGLPNEYNYTGTGLADETSTSLTDSQSVVDYVVVSGVQSWTSSVDYDEGDQPLSSKGNNYLTALAAGTTSPAKSVSITGVYPFYATTVAMGTVTKQTLVAHTSSYFSASMVAETGGEKQTCDLPDAVGALTGIQFYNTVSSAWEWVNGSAANSLLTFTETSTTHDVNGSTIDYARFTHNGSNVGARLLRFYRV
jgi:hypothetical protein